MDTRRPVFGGVAWLKQPYAIVGLNGIVAVVDFDHVAAFVLTWRLGEPCPIWRGPVDREEIPSAALDI